MATNFYNIPELDQNAPFNVVADVNAGFVATDTAIHNVETKIPDVTQIEANVSAVDTKATEAQATAGNAYSTAQNAQTAAAQANNTANQASATAGVNSQNIEALKNALALFESEFNFTSKTAVTAQELFGGSGSEGAWRLAQNATGELFKFYGYIKVTPNKSKQRIAIPGLAGKYGINTTLKLLKNPTTAYEVETSGVFAQSVTNSQNIETMDNSHFAVGTDGYIYFSVDTSASTFQSGSRYVYEWSFPCIYFNDASFGDTPAF